MKPHPSNPILARLARSSLLAILLLTMLSPGALASERTQNNTENLYVASISQSKDPICVGDTVNVTVNWAPNPHYMEGSALAPLTPLTGPTRIKLQANLGYFYPDSPPMPGSNSGTVTVAYTAEKEGSETIFAQLWQGGSSDAIVKTFFEVKICKYKFSLNAQFDLAVTTEELSYTVRYTVKTSGALVPPDPDKPLNLEARTKVVRLSAVVTSWASSKCTLFTYEPGTGMGYVDARADPGPMGIGMVLQLAPPQDLAWDVDLSFACDGDAKTVAFVYPLSPPDPWVKATFLDGSGQQDIKLDMFEVPYQRLLGSEGITVSYTATLKLEKEKP